MERWNETSKCGMLGKHKDFNMLKSHISVLDQTGKDLLKKASHCTQASDAETFTNLGLKCLQDARDILDTMRLDSVALYFECCAQLESIGNYISYLEFCARNSLPILAQSDFELKLKLIENALVRK